MIYLRYRMELDRRLKREMSQTRMYTIYSLILQVMKSVSDELVRLSNQVQTEKRNRDESE